jgi:TolB protein
MGGPVTRILATVLATVLLFEPLAAAAQTDVRIDIKGSGQKQRLLIEPLQPQGDAPARTFGPQADEVLANDLATSGVFTVSRSWAGGADPNSQFVVHGRLRVEGSRLRLTGEVHDLPGRRPVFSREYTGTLSEWRALTHTFADDVVFQFTGELGVASTRLAFVVRNGQEKELWVMDADGARPSQLTNDRSIAQSPAWAPDGSLILFSSYRGGKGPRVFVTSPRGGKVYLVSGREGLNIAPAYSPDGRDIACTLSHDGNPEIYLLDARGGSPRRITHQRGIDTSPAWAPTGRQIAFTSDRGGQPNVYVMSREGADVKRLTYEIGYSDSPAWSPKGDRIAFVSRAGNGFDIYVCRPDGGDVRLVVSGGSNENPRWSPDGRHLVFASNRGGGSGLYVTDLDGSPPRRLDTGGRNASSPAWSPRLTPSGAARPADNRSAQGGIR